MFLFLILFLVTTFYEAVSALPASDDKHFDLQVVSPLGHGLPDSLHPFFIVFPGLQTDPLRKHYFFINLNNSHHPEYRFYVADDGQLAYSESESVEDQLYCTFHPSYPRAGLRGDLSASFFPTVRPNKAFPILAPYFDKEKGDIMRLSEQGDWYSCTEPFVSPFHPGNTNLGFQWHYEPPPRTGQGQDYPCTVVVIRTVYRDASTYTKRQS